MLPLRMPEFNLPLASCTARNSLLVDCPITNNSRNNKAGTLTVISMRARAHRVLIRDEQQHEPLTRKSRSNAVICMKYMNIYLESILTDRICKSLLCFAHIFLSFNDHSCLSRVTRSALVLSSQLVAVWGQVRTVFVVVMLQSLLLLLQFAAVGLNSAVAFGIGAAVAAWFAQMWVKFDAWPSL